MIKGYTNFNALKSRSALIYIAERLSVLGNIAQKCSCVIYINYTAPNKLKWKGEGPGCQNIPQNGNW